MYCEIVKTPSGEAPERIRTAWIGCVLPLAGTGIFEAVAVLTGVRANVEGVLVNGYEAFAVLRQRNGEAYAWWVENAGVWLNQRLIFEAGASEMREGLWIVREVVAGLFEFDHGPYPDERAASATFEFRRRHGFRVMSPVEMPPDYKLLAPPHGGCSA
jgi:hypothetical protein